MRSILRFFGVVVLWALSFALLASLMVFVAPGKTGHFINVFVLIGLILGALGGVFCFFVRGTKRPEQQQNKVGRRIRPFRLYL
jgi:hypothetical protein